jgi:acetoin utilization deacetylase AcuC-like enzyme
MLVVASDHHRLHHTDAVPLAGATFSTGEVPARAVILQNAVESTSWCQIIAPMDCGMTAIQEVHTGEYLGFLQEANQIGQDLEALIHPHVFSPRQAIHIPRSLGGRVGYFSFGAYTPILRGTWEAAYWSAQCGLTGARELVQGEPTVYALCRPPGHHAGADLFGGFCYLNNAAIAARELQRQRAGARISILDIDYHHGNGTQLIFYQDPSVQFCSLHAHPDEEYPYYWGDSNERGEGPGEGTNHNWPLPQGTPDTQYLETLEQALLTIEAYSPDFLVISAGLDIVQGDPEGGFEISQEGLEGIGRMIAGLGCKTLIIQEGGYLLETLGQSLLALLGGIHAVRFDAP